MAGEAKVVLLTGCSSGIGMTTAILLAKDGEKRFRVYATVRDLEKTGNLEREAGSLLGQTLFIRELNVCSEKQINEVVDGIVKAEEKIDILVNNAGIGLFGALEAQPVDKIKTVFSTNVYGPINLTKKVVETWKQTQFGHLIMLSSVGGVIGIPFNSIYCASKFALEGFSEALAVEFKSSGMRVSIIQPGPVASFFINNTMDFSEIDSQMEKVDEHTKETMNIFMEKRNSRFATMVQDSDEVAQYILNAIDDSNPQFRYQTNKVYTTAIEQKLNDNTGINTYV